ncbi:glycosyltransferase [Caenimonas koreensis DSM 17982]|uniref:Glycosyltransferase n=1 Tax=Caenimonas koreensis DSM 17982 TaxID=1121255 RepID=A0A844BEG9_9BURK|nr:glycosyltransferase family 4 protein [Caenimonas koreensis]MRD48851.1 glycosyltransferase [Caenimonas koreensis DSM 17982]
MLVLTEFPPAVGGMQTHARHLAAHLSRRADAVEVLTYRITDPQLAAQAHAFDSQCGYPVHRVLSRLGYWHNMALLLERVRRFRPDAIYASTVFYGLLRTRTDLPLVCRSVGNDVLRPWLGYPYRAFSRLVGSRAVQHGLRWWLEHAHHPDWVDRLFRRAREQLMRDAAASQCRILANSDFTAQLLQGIGVARSRIDVAAGGVDCARFEQAAGARQLARHKLGLREDDVVLLTVCRLVAKKGVEILLKALALLRPEFPALKLVVVGDGRKRKAYMARALSLGLADVVRFAGRVPHEDIPPFFWASDLFVLASYESLHAGGAARDVETMGRVLCEANAAGLPLVATASGGTPSVVRSGENGLLVAPGDPRALADAMARVLRDPQLAAQLRAAGLERARSEFDWSAVLPRHEMAIARAIADKSVQAA